MHAAIGITMKHTVEDDVHCMIDDQMETATKSVQSAVLAHTVATYIPTYRAVNLVCGCRVSISVTTLTCLNSWKECCWGIPLRHAQPADVLYINSTCASPV